MQVGGEEINKCSRVNNKYKHSKAIKPNLLSETERKKMMGLGCGGVFFALIFCEARINLGYNNNICNVTMFLSII